MPKNTIGKIGWFFTNSNTTGAQFIGGEYVTSCVMIWFVKKDL
jgi:hypothetical protein